MRRSFFASSHAMPPKHPTRSLASGSIVCNFVSQPRRAECSANTTHDLHGQTRDLRLRPASDLQRQPPRSFDRRRQRHFQHQQTKAPTRNIFCFANSTQCHPNAQPACVWKYCLQFLLISYGKWKAAPFSVCKRPGKTRDQALTSSSHNAPQSSACQTFIRG